MAEKDITLKELIQDIDFRLTHIEDIEADNRKLIIKLIKQGNTIVDFLKRFEVEEDFESHSYEMDLPELPISSDKTNERFKSLKEVLDNYIEKHQDLKEFEKELRKHKDDITPGTVGES